MSERPTDSVPLAPQAHEPYPEEVETLELDGRRIVLVGTAHVSQESVVLVRRVIERERPDVVCVELDSRRFEALSHKKGFEGLDLREVIRKRQLATLLLNLFLASHQKRLGGQLGVTPGSELLEAIEVAKSCDVKVELCDRDVRITLRRAWRALPLTKKALLISGVLASVGQTQEISEEELRRLKRRDVLSEMMQELGEAMPELKRVLIDERDSYLATKIARTEGRSVVAVVGAGHLAGMVQALRERREADLEELERIPNVSAEVKAIGLSISLLFLSAIGYIGATRGLHAARDNAIIWALGRAIPAAIGGLAALAHPVTIAVAFLAAPFPIAGVGYLSAFVQAYLVPPRVHEFRTVSEDLNHARKWWSNRLLRVFLVFILTSVGRMLGTWLAGAKIVSNLVHPG